MEVSVRPRVLELVQPMRALARFVPALRPALATSIEAVRRAIDTAVDDPRVAGVVFVVPPLHCGWATATSLRDQVERCRRAGKQTVVYLVRGGGHRELYVATAAERVLAAPHALIDLSGMSVEAIYLRPLLGRAGVSVERFARKEYKTAWESFALDQMSEGQREQLEALLGSLDRALRTALASRPRLDDAAVASLFERAWWQTEDAVDVGLLDGTCYEDELPARLAESPADRAAPVAGADPLTQRAGAVVAAADPQPAKVERAGRYQALRRRPFFEPLRTPPYIAVVAIRGAIAEEIPGRGPMRQKVAAALRTARADERALGVLLWVSSPGGSASASDALYREVERVREKKPVVAYFGDVAASGGYYVAAGADAIVAQPSSLTGSIGVVSARLDASALLERLGLHTEVIRTAPHADMGSMRRPLSDDERAIWDRELDAFYERFVSLVSEGRGDSLEATERKARGRVYSGAAAAEASLVDRLGGLEVALDELKSRLDVSDAVKARLRPRLVHVQDVDVPPAPPPSSSAVGAVMSATAVRALAPELGDLLALLGAEDRVLYYAPLVAHLRFR